MDKHTVRHDHNDTPLYHTLHVPYYECQPWHHVQSGTQLCLVLSRCSLNEDMPFHSADVRNRVHVHVHVIFTLGIIALQITIKSDSGIYKHVHVQGVSQSRKINHKQLIN